MTIYYNLEKFALRDFHNDPTTDEEDQDAVDELLNLSGESKFEGGAKDAKPAEKPPPQKSSRWCCGKKMDGKAS